MSKVKDKKFTKRDLKWILIILLIVIGFLVTINVYFVSLKLSDDQNVTNILSIGGSVVSIILGFFAIIISYVQNNSSQDLHGRMSGTLEAMNQKLDNIGRNIAKTKAFTKEEEEPTTDVGQNRHNLTRLHGIYSTSVQWNGRDLVRELRRELTSINANYKLIDYSIQPLSISQHNQFSFSTSVSLLFTPSISPTIIHKAVDDSFERLGISSLRTDVYTNEQL